MANENCFIEPKEDVESFIEKLHTILNSGNYELDILPKKKNEKKNDPFTTQNTLKTLGLIEDEDIADEFLSLSVKDYIETMKDDKPNKSDFRVFGKVIDNKEVYIKLKIKKDKDIFCVSFHFAKYPLKQRPYK